MVGRSGFKGILGYIGSRGQPGLGEVEASLDYVRLFLTNKNETLNKAKPIL